MKLALVACALKENGSIYVIIGVKLPNDPIEKLELLF